MVEYISVGKYVLKRHIYPSLDEIFETILLICWYQDKNFNQSHFVVQKSRTDANRYDF